MTHRRPITIEASEEDVGLIRGQAELCEMGGFEYSGNCTNIWLRDLASRIEAALREEGE